MSYTDTEDLTDEQIIRRNLEKVAVGVQHLVSPETQDLREQKRKREQRQYELERARNSKLSELQIAREKERQAADTAADLLRRGWKRYPKNQEKYYHQTVCPFGCTESVMILDHNSPHLSETDSLLTAFSKDHTDSTGFNFDQIHLCDDLSGTQLRGIIQYLVNTTDNLKAQLIRNDEKARNYANMASMGPR